MRWLFRIFGVLFLAVLAIVIGVLLLPGEKIAQIAADQIEARTGRELSIEGKVKVTLWPVLGVTTGPVTMGNASWAGESPMFTAQSLAIGVAAPDLLRGAIRVTGIVAQDPVLRMQSLADGRVNWTFSAADIAPSDTASTEDVAATDNTQVADADTPITLQKLRLSNATLIYAAADAAPVTLANADLKLDWLNSNGPADIAATLRPADEPIQIDARVAQFSGFLDGIITPVSVSIHLPGGKATFDGRANITGDAEGRLVLTSTDTAEVVEALGLGQIALSHGMGQKGDLAADVTYTSDGHLSFRDVTVDLDHNRMSGGADIRFGDVPQITARLSAGMLDFSATAPNAGGADSSAGTSGAPDAADAPGTTAEGWSKTPIDASALSLANVSLNMSAQGIKLPDLTLGPTQGRLRIDRARAVLDLARVSVFSGVINGQLVANNRSGFSVGGNLNASDIEIVELQRDLLGFERVSGKASAGLEFLGVGESVDSIMRSLSGKGSLQTGRGVIMGLDLDRLMRSGDGSGGTTVFDSLTASYTMQAGDLFNTDLLLSLKNFKADGAGRIGLGARDIDYLFTPVALRVNSGQGLAIPIRISGPWAAPRIRPDLEAAAKAKIDLKREELEEKAKSQLQQKLAEELEVKVEEGQDTEEVLKDRLEDEAKNQLLKLLGKN